MIANIGKNDEKRDCKTIFLLFALLFSIFCTLLMF